MAGPMSQIYEYDRKYDDSSLLDNFDGTINYGTDTRRNSLLPSSIDMNDIEFKYNETPPLHVAKNKTSCLGKGCKKMSQQLKKVAKKLRNITKKNRSESVAYDEIGDNQLGGFHLYKEMGLRKNASIKKIKKKFRKVKKAYKTLSNKKKRLKYHMKYRKSKKKKRRRRKTKKRRRSRKRKRFRK